MSESQDNRPEESTAESASAAPAAGAPSTPEQTAPAALETPSVPEAPAAPQGAWVAPSGPDAQATAPQEQAPQQQPASQPTAPQPPVSQPPVPHQAAAQYPAGAPQQAPAYGAAPAYPGTHAGAAYGQAKPQPGQPYAGQAFGVPPQQTQPTLPLGGHPDAAPQTGAVATATAPKKKSSAGRITGLLVAAALVGGAAGLGGSYAGASLWGTSAASTATGGSVITVNNTDSVNSTTAVAAKVTPSVVTISVTAGTSGGTGSGVVLSADGYVLTNTHVVTLDGATADPTISVTTSDGKVYKATVVGTDPTYDLAVIKLTDASGLTPISWGDSSKINVGDQTIAIGAPLGLANTVTTGIVSALNRSIEIASSAAPDSSDSSGSGDSGDGGSSGDSPFQFDFGQGQSTQTTTETIKIAVIQTDAAINPGNSGGALVDSDGNLIGINVAIASTGSTSSSSSQSGSIGVGFSIPSDIAKRVSQELIDNGTATHGLLGASVQDAASVQGSTITGAYVAEATAGGAAASAGLQKGDIITQFNGVPVTDSVDLTAQVRAVAGGSKASVTYVRDGKTQTTEVTLGTLGQ